MLREVIELQDQAVKDIIHQTSIKNELTFKAPTGSGKTYMMADYMNRMITKDSDVVFIVSTLSKGNLAEQNYQKFCEYANSKRFFNLNPYLINSETSGESALFIPTLHNVYVLPRDLYKKNGKLMEGAFNNFLRTMTQPSPFGKGKKIYLIKDECHIATNNLDSVSSYFTKVINFSATPNLKRGQHPDAQIKESDAINAKLIKKVNYESLDDSLDMALKKFEAVKEKYVEKLGINPCMIIQISNKDKADDELKNIFTTLNKTEHQDLKWMLIVDKDKDCDTNDVFKAKKIPVDKWKDYAKTNSATIDIIIFKMVITEGWDIPRACMLYQVRDTKSKQLDEQVIGRVRRNPRLLDFEKLSSEAQELAMQAYVWGLTEDSRTFHEVKLHGKQNSDNEIQKEMKLKTTVLKPPTTSIAFDVNDYLNKAKPKLLVASIFDLYNKYSQATPEVQEMCADYTKSISDWYKFMENIDDISRENNRYMCSYEISMELAKNEDGSDKLVSFPLTTYHEETSSYTRINEWIWKRTDTKDSYFFDSEAEKEWAEILIKLTSKDAPTGTGRVVKDITVEDSDDKKYLVARNFFANSEIKYEYYLNGIHSSYPDFIMKDFDDRIHIFESKSLNKASDSPAFDPIEYEEKIQALRECYKYASKLTGYYFYIPIKQGLEWKIYKMFDGKEELLSEKSFLDFFKK